MARPVVDMKGQRLGKLVVIERAENTKRNKAQWLCKCDCGNKVIVARSGLKNGTVSCGCYRVEYAKIHNSKHHMKGTRLYRIWSGVKDRCSNPKSKYWNRYGGRGILMHDDWKDFKNFMAWSLSNGYSDVLTLDRIDNNVGYYPENCRWVDMVVQENNRTNNVRIEFESENHTISEWSRIKNINYRTLYGRFRNGWSVEDALTKKVGYKYGK